MIRNVFSMRPLKSIFGVPGFEQFDKLHMFTADDFKMINLKRVMDINAINDG